MQKEALVGQTHREHLPVSEVHQHFSAILPLVLHLWPTTVLLCSHHQTADNAGS